MSYQAVLELDHFDLQFELLQVVFDQFELQLYFGLFPYYQQFDHWFVGGHLLLQPFFLTYLLCFDRSLMNLL